jgi:hypothetical protein
MQAEVTSIFTPQARYQHVDQVALAGGSAQAEFETKDYGLVTLQRGDGSRAGTFLARSAGFNVSAIIGADGDQAAICTFDFNKIIINDASQLASLRENVDAMLQQCNKVTRR